MVREVVVLGEVLATFKVLPEDVSTDLKGIEESSGLHLRECAT